MTIREELVPIGHPNRPGVKLEALKALVFHYTANDAPGATDTMNAKYFGRRWLGTLGDPFEADGKTPFRYGSTQIIADEDSVTVAIPPDEAAWACGDRNAGAWTPEWKGQRPMAKHLFGWRQNYQSVSVEICNNRSWEAAVDNAAAWAIDFLKKKGLTVDLGVSLSPQEPRPLEKGAVAICRHYDVTGKVCAKPFVDNTSAWAELVWKIHDSVLGEK